MPFLLENVSQWEEEKEQPSNTSALEGGAPCGTAYVHKQPKCCYWVCGTTCHSTFHADDMIWYDMKRKNTLDNSKNEIHMKYHRTVEGEICDITQIQSQLLGGCFVSIQVNKPFESDTQPAPCRCQHIKCPLQPVSNLLLWQSAGWEGLHYGINPSLCFTGRLAATQWGTRSIWKG